VATISVFGLVLDHLMLRSLGIGFASLSAGLAHSHGYYRLEINNHV